MLIAPTEPPALKALGTSSSIPERYGVDVLFASRAYGAVGIQRKEVSDLVASVYDGRLQRELPQMAGLGLAVLLIEGRVTWGNDGSLISRAKWTRAQHLGLIWSVQSRGYWIANSDGLADTCDWISRFTKWTEKERHGSLTSRPGPSNGAWGLRDNRDWAVHVLQGFDGMGSERAGILYDRYGLPLQWVVTKKEMKSLPKFGKVTVDRLFAALGQEGLEDYGG